MDHSMEIEVKFYVPQVEPVRERLCSLGASCQGRIFEKNICLDNASGDLKKQGKLLRLRKDRKSRLTFKAPPGETDREFKIYEEIEVEVGDFDRCRFIFEALGFHTAQVYEKWRETFVLGDTQLLIDTTPFGVFLEIEGRKEEIRKLSERLGFRWTERILFELIRREQGLPFKDMTFENFQSANCDVVPYLSAMTAGVHP